MYIQSGLSYKCSLYVVCWFFVFAGMMRTGLDNKLYKMHSTYIKIHQNHTHTHTRFSWPTLAICLHMCRHLQDSSSDIILSSNPRQVAAAAIIPEQHILVLPMTSMILTPGHPLTQDQAAHDRWSLTWFPGCRIPRGSASCNNALICFRM